jgi:2,3-bisphosphoglycerate-dependent phosphoglycerate mutase
MRDRTFVTAFLRDKSIDAVLSSPFKRAVDTVADFAAANGFDIELIEDFRERKSDGNWLRDTDFFPFMERQWADFSYTLSDGESLAEVQERNIVALTEVLRQYKGKTIVVGTHGTALSTIINYYDDTHGFHDFMSMVNIMPWVVKADFDDYGCMGMEKIDLFRPAPADAEIITTRTAALGALRSYRYVVVFARCRGKWLYCRAKTRDGYETAGGHIEHEQGETPLDAAKRELYEETGAARFDVTPAFDYSVHYPHVYSNGQVFLAHIHELGDLPDYEMAEVRQFDAIPDKMRFPQILPVLFDKIRDICG